MSQRAAGQGPPAAGREGRSVLAGWCGTVSPGDLATGSARDLAANTWLLHRAVRVGLVARTVMPSAGGSSVPVDQ